MPIIRVYTDDGKEVDQLKVPDTLSNQARGRVITGHLNGMSGWLDRALDDAIVVQKGGDPERPSEKAMRLAMEHNTEEE